VFGLCVGHDEQQLGPFLTSCHEPFPLFFLNMTATSNFRLIPHSTFESLMSMAGAKNARPRIQPMNSFIFISLIIDAHEKIEK
jgi:hypothetical protein